MASLDSWGNSRRSSGIQNRIWKGVSELLYIYTYYQRTWNLPSPWCRMGGHGNDPAHHDLLGLTYTLENILCTLERKNWYLSDLVQEFFQQVDFEFVYVSKLLFTRLVFQSMRQIVEYLASLTHFKAIYCQIRVFVWWIEILVRDRCVI